MPIAWDDCGCTYADDDSLVFRILAGAFCAWLEWKGRAEKEKENMSISCLARRFRAYGGSFLQAER